MSANNPGRRIEVVNAGVPGHTSVEQRINFMLRISTLQPDAMLNYHANDDLAEPATQAPGTPDLLTDWRHFTAKDEQLMAQIWFDTLGQTGWLEARTAN